MGKGGEQELREEEDGGERKKEDDENCDVVATSASQRLLGQNAGQVEAGILWKVRSRWDRPGKISKR